ncbi:hypothetical protein BDV38DRAFT_283189 [Aspergillus pseudotamarii]|uniref:Uncharacterized protein n=1 Tax=Aspergillus pseudotamarii TaxID=132259 RepID=A0A5N6SU45_ASPPS|nr:uncharacterized protein BDV38DRAFT_283189 [Aspergillus pseudotamarii]KAE8137349.1 hypothetical protein BDV38DRAFT_283189 [Aspergillus pseudotamarii]
MRFTAASFVTLGLLASALALPAPANSLEVREPSKDKYAVYDVPEKRSKEKYAVYDVPDRRSKEKYAVYDVPDKRSKEKYATYDVPEEEE